MGYAKMVGRNIPDSVFASFLVRIRPIDDEYRYYFGLAITSSEFLDFAKFRGWLQNVIIMLSWVLLELLAAGRQRVKTGRMVRKNQKFRRFCNREERK